MIKKFVRHVSSLGTAFFCLILVIFTYLNNQEQLSVKLLLMFLFITLIGEGIKFFYPKHRPDFDPKERYNYIWPINKLIEVDERSFPSLHSARAAGLLVILGVYFQIFYLQLFLGLLALGVAASRVYLKRHYIEDVAAGFIFGLLVSGMVLYLTF